MLLTSIREVADEPVVLAPRNPRAEFANTCWLSATREDLSTLSVDHVVTAFTQTAADLRRKVGEMSFRGTATFYVWHDEQAGQLRCSVSSRAPTDLPFGGTYRPTDDLGSIVASFLADTTPGEVSWDDLGPTDGDAPAEIEAFSVWTCDLSQVQ